MKKASSKIFIGAVGAILLLVMVACAAPTGPDGGSGGGNPTPTPTTAPPPANVPSKISVNLPKSLTTAAPAASRMKHKVQLARTTSQYLKSHPLPARSIAQGTHLVRSRSVSSGPGRRLNSGSTYSEQSSSYSQIVSSVDNMKESIFEAASTLILVDAAIEQNGISTSSSTVPETSITVTQTMVDQMKAMVPDAYADDISLPSVGDSEDIPAFVYNTFTHTTDNPFDYQFVINSDSYDDGDYAYSDTMSLYWDSAKKSVKLSFDGSETYASDSSYDSTYTYSIAYDDTSKTSTMIDKTAGDTFSYSSKVQLAEDANKPTTHGVFVFFDESYKDSTYDPAYSYSYKAKGLADDNGGYLQSSYGFSDGTFGGAEKYYYKEGFDGAGTLTGAQESDDGTTYTDDSPTWASHGSNATYETYFEESASALATASTALDDSDFVSDDSYAAGSYYFGETVDSSYNVAVGNEYVVYDSDITDAGSFNPAGSATWTSPQEDAVNSFVGWAYGDDTDYLDIYFDTELKHPNDHVYLLKVTYDSGSGNYYFDGDDADPAVPIDLTL